MYQEVIAKKHNFSSYFFVVFRVFYFFSKTLLSLALEKTDLKRQENWILIQNSHSSLFSLLISLSLSLRPKTKQKTTRTVSISDAQRRDSYELND